MKLLPLLLAVIPLSHAGPVAPAAGVAPAVEIAPAVVQAAPVSKAPKAVKTPMNALTTEDMRYISAITAANSAWGPNMGANNPKWMSGIPDTTNLADISIPGTHDTMTFNIGQATGFGFVKCQNANLDLQYNSGIRFVDIRCHHENNRFEMYHGDFKLGKTFTDVIRSTGAFLDANPSEVIIMRVKHEGGDNGGKGTFVDQLNDYMKNNGDTKDIFARRHYVVNDEHTWPKLGQARGKFIMLTNYPGAQPGQGIPYGDETDMLTISDDYAVHAIQTKWDGCAAKLNGARSTSSAVDKRMWMTYTSGSPGMRNLDAVKFQPIYVAMGYPGFFGAGKYQGMNERAYNLLGSWGGRGRAGVVVMDFPGQGLVDYVWRLNFPSRQKTLAKKWARWF